MTERKPRKSKFDQNIYGDSNDYADVIGEVDDRQAQMEAKLLEKRRETANKGQLIEETKMEGG